MANPPKLTQSTALAKAQATDNRLSALIPTTTTELSPVRIYTASNSDQVNGNAGALTEFTWICPDGITEVQVECYGSGGGGGGSSFATGGGGGGGGEYACEPNYPVTPGEAYSYYAGPGGRGGETDADGLDGVNTHFDFQGKGIEGGVLASGGSGGGFAGDGGLGGTGSPNSIHFDGGQGGSTSSGVQSDNPKGFMTTQSDLQMWWILDDNSQTASDSSTHNRASIYYVQQPGAVVKPVSGQSQPVQVPYLKASTETDGNVWKFDIGSSSTWAGGLVGPSDFHAGSNYPKMTFSIWLKGNTSRSSWGGTPAIIAGTMDPDAASPSGWMLCMENGFLKWKQTQASHPGVIFTLTGPANGSWLSDNTWHHCVVTWDNSLGSNRAKMYIDGSLFTQGDPSNPTQPLAITSNPLSVAFDWSGGWHSFYGFLSNMWLASEAVTAGQVAVAFGSSVSTGGSGGGASGGSAGTGNTGSTAAGATGGAGGTSAAASSTLTHGSGAGGAGGNSGANGVTAPAVTPFAGGGGGAGKYSVSSGMASTTITAIKSASFTGLDSDGGAIGQLYTISLAPNPEEPNPVPSTAALDSLCYHGGQAAKPYQGTMNSIIQFPVQKGVLPAGSTVWKAWLSLTVNTKNAANLRVRAIASNAIPGELSSTAEITALNIISSFLLHVPAGDVGRTETLAITDSLFLSNLTSSATGVGLLIGLLDDDPTYGEGDGEWNSNEVDDWYCEFYGAGTDDAVNDMALTMETVTTNSVVAGNGADGFIVVSFIDPSGTPITTVLPAAETDANGNSLPAGVATNQWATWQPGSSPLQIESWHTVTGDAGWSAVSGYSGIKYKLLPGNLIQFTGAAQHTNFTSTTAINSGNPLPATYRPATIKVLADGNNPIGRFMVEYRTDGILYALSNASTTTATVAEVDKIVPLDA